MIVYRSCAIGAHGMDQLFISKELDKRLILFSERGYSIDSVTPHFVNHGKENEYLEYIIVYSAELAEGENITKSVHTEELSENRLME